MSEERFTFPPGFFSLREKYVLKAVGRLPIPSAEQDVLDHIRESLKNAPDGVLVFQHSEITVERIEVDNEPAKEPEKQETWRDRPPLL